MLKFYYLAISVLALLPEFLFASGNTLPRPTASAFGMADANVALSSGPSAQFINPANIVGSGSPDVHWETGTLFGSVSAHLNRPAAAGATAAGGYDAKTTYPVIPYAALTYKYSDRATIGVSLESPHGLSSEWPDHSFDLDLGPFGTADLAKKAELTVIRIGPAIGFRVDDHWNIGTRLFAQYVEAKEENDISTVKGDGTSAGAQLGIRYQAPNYIVGAAYTTRTNTEIKGSLSNIHPVAAASLIAGDARADILLPDRLQTGLAWRIHPDVWWELDLDWIGWSYVDELTIIQSDGSIANAGKNERHSKNTLSVRTGVKWQRSPKLELYAGLGYDPSPVAEEDVVPTSAMVRKTRVGLGATRLLERGMRLDVAYQYIRGHARQVNETTQDTFGGSETNLFEGTYNSRSHVLGVNVSGAF